MTSREVFDSITSEPKWYAGFTSRQNARNIKVRFNNNELNMQTLERLFNHFGYFLDIDWYRKDERCNLEHKIVGYIVPKNQNFEIK